MKKNLFYGLTALLLLSTAVFIIGCGSNASGGGSNGGGGGASMVTITGHVTGSGFTISLVPTPISKVVIFNCYGGFWVADVSGGTFTGEAEVGRPIGLIFSDSANAFRGYLTMGSSIDSVPLNLIDSASTEVNLSTLFLDNSTKVATCENKLIDDALLINVISTSDVSAMSFGNQLFSSVIKNPDADKNGEVDILETTAKYYRPYFLYFVNGGSLTSSAGDGIKSPTVAASTLVDQYRFNIDVYKSDGGLPLNITIKDPVTSGRTATFDANSNTNSTTRHIYYDSQVRNGTPDAGTYTVTGFSSTISFEVSNSAIATQFIAIAKPTVTVSGGNVTQISWSYVAGGSGGSLTDPRSLVEIAGIQIDNSSLPQSQRRIYDTQLIYSPSFTSHTLTNAYSSSGSAIAWSDVTDILMAYNDVFGNHVVVKWTK